jgi:hypothetical protein
MGTKTTRKKKKITTTTIATLMFTWCGVLLKIKYELTRQPIRFRAPMIQNISSFQRQLNMYGFSKISGGELSGGFRREVSP